MSLKKAKLQPWCQAIVDEARLNGFSVIKLAGKVGRRGVNVSTVYRWGKQPEAKAGQSVAMLRDALGKLLTGPLETVDRPVYQSSVRGDISMAIALLERAERALAGTAADVPTDRERPRVPADPPADRRPHRKSG